MGHQIYIHYGSIHFDPTKGFPIENRKCWNKPKGGLWASRIDASFGWKDWCREECFRECFDSNSFKFTIKDGYSVCTISTMQQLIRLLRQNVKPDPYISEYPVDFVKCLDMSIDAIELCWYGKEYKDISSGDLYRALYGWDCDSIVVLNPDAVLPM